WVAGELLDRLGRGGACLGVPRDAGAPAPPVVARPPRPSRLAAPPAPGRPPPGARGVGADLHGRADDRHELLPVLVLRPPRPRLERLLTARAVMVGFVAEPTI